MRILDTKQIDDYNEEFTLELTLKERSLIRKHYGWKRLTKNRIEKWFNETLKNTIKKEKQNVYTKTKN